MQKNHLYSLDMLRGLVALLVCLYHLTDGFFPVEHWLKIIFSRGYLGVEIFFVISGFVIPYTMYKTNYTLRDAGSFILRRLTRIEPPYWCSILLIFIGEYLSRHLRYYKDKIIIIDWYDILTHVLHLNDLINKPWLRGIYWSLAIEVQYYLLIALIFPLLIFKNRYLSYTVLLIFCLLRWIEWPHTVFYYGCHFAIGILLFNAFVGTISKIELFVSLSIAFVLTWWCFDLYHLSAVFGAVIFIWFFNFNIKPFVFLGKISYSFYLIHIQFGWSVFDYLLREYPYDSKIKFLIYSVLVAILASIIFYYLIERPSHLLARKIGDKKIKTLEVPAL
jgi:peptidoglycan/LPS O-acetylase OafA/YrhL